MLKSVTSVFYGCESTGRRFLLKISKSQIFFDLTFTDFHMGCKKGPKSISNYKNHRNLFDYLLINVSLEDIVLHIF